MSIALATRGIISSCCQKNNVIISFDKPQTQTILEVHPKIRYISSSPVPILSPPTIIAITELRPITHDAVTPSAPSIEPVPHEFAAIELRPVIKKVEKI
jgi:hypothetical protein